MFEQVDEVIDSPFSDIQQKIRAFAIAQRSAKILVLVIMSHGDEKDNMLFSSRSLTKRDILNLVEQSQIQVLSLTLIMSCCFYMFTYV